MRNVGYNLDNTNNINLENLLKYRELKLETESKHRTYRAKVNLIMHNILEKFCKWYHSQFASGDFNKDEILLKWAEFYTNLESIEVDKENKDLFINTQEQLDKYRFQLEEQFQVFCKTFAISKI